MINKLQNFKILLQLLPHRLSKIQKEITEQKILAAKALINSFDYTLDLPIASYEFKVSSQWGDDGIIQYLIDRLDISSKKFIEFGVEDYTEANTLFLLLNNNWSGLIMDASQSNMTAVKNSELSWKFDLETKATFITKENIDHLISSAGFAGEIGILSVDIDGNDYWVWDTISTIEPVIVITEYNSIFGYENPWTIPYKPDFIRGEAHFSNLYYGSSILSLCDLAEKKGYYFIGCNSAGNNAYFIKKDKIGPIKPLTAQEGYVMSKFKESRDKEGHLSFFKGNARLQLLTGMPVFNTRSLKTEYI